MNTLDLLDDLTSPERTLTRILLRKIELSEDALFAAVSELPEAKRMNRTEMQTALAGLLEKGWLSLKDKAGQRIYRLEQQS